MGFQLKRNINDMSINADKNAFQSCQQKCMPKTASTVAMAPGSLTLLGVSERSCCDRDINDCVYDGQNGSKTQW